MFLNSPLTTAGAVKAGAGFWTWATVYLLDEHSKKSNEREMLTHFYIIKVKKEEKRDVKFAIFITLFFSVSFFQILFVDYKNLVTSEWSLNWLVNRSLSNQM